MSRRVAACLCLAGVLAGCAGGGTPAEPPAPLTPLIPGARVKVLWRHDVGGPVDGLVVRLDRGALYVSNVRGQVSAIAAGSGKTLWRTQLKARLSGGTGVGDDLVIVGSPRGEVYALAESTGKLRWTAQVTSEIRSPPAAAAGVVIVQSIDGRVQAFSAADGKALWTYERAEPVLILRGSAAPTVSGSTVLAGFASGKVEALGIADGRPRWQLAVAEPHGRTEIERLVDIDAQPLVAGDTVYAASYQGRIVAADRHSGRLLWARPASTYTGLDADAGNVYFTDEHGYVVALDRRTGASVWRQEQLRGRHLTAPRYVDGYVAVGDYQGYVHWLSREDGHIVARTRVGDAIRSAPAASGDTLYVVADNGDLAALRLVPKGTH